MTHVIRLVQGTCMEKADRISDSETLGPNFSFKIASHLPTHFKAASRTAGPLHVKSLKSPSEDSSQHVQNRITRQKATLNCHLNRRAQFSCVTHFVYDTSCCSCLLVATANTRTPPVHGAHQTLSSTVSLQPTSDETKSEFLRWRHAQHLQFKGKRP